MVNPRVVLGGVVVAGTLTGLVCLPVAGTAVPDAGPPPLIEGLPEVVADAYWAAAGRVPALVPGCSVPWWLLAGIGEIESSHGRAGGSTVSEAGEVAPPIIGPRVAGLADTDGGRWDGDEVQDRAVGPMQILPSTWASVGVDGDGDGRADPQNIYDSALSAAVYLCRAAGSLETRDQQSRGLLAYNHSPEYVTEVLAAAERYQQVTDLGDLVEVAGIGLTSASWAPQVRALLAAARADGLGLSGSSYRDRASQVLLRRRHCGASSYAIYEMPASECTPPTAKPGTSLHERGLAIDFEDCADRSTACFRWLAVNAERFGLHNLASESWHWSRDGT